MARHHRSIRGYPGREQEVRVRTWNTDDVEPPAIRPFTDVEAANSALWVYEPPFDPYNSDPSNPELFLRIDDDGFGYYALTDAADEVVGFCCYGVEARVSPQMPEDGTIDLGGGVRPDRLSEGIGTATLPAVMAFARGRWQPQRFRVAVATFNDRSIGLCRTAGFEVARSFSSRDDRDFLELVRQADRT